MRLPTEPMTAAEFETVIEEARQGIVTDEGLSETLSELIHEIARSADQADGLESLIMRARAVFAAEHAN